MSITVQPANPTSGQIINFKLTYEGKPPPPTDVHVEVENGGVWQPVVGYDDLGSVTNDKGAKINPLNGFDLPVPPTPNWSAPGLHRFRVQWTRRVDNTQQNIGTETVDVTTSPAPSTSASKQWSWGEFISRILGGVVAGALFGLVSNVLAGAITVVCVLLGAGSGGLGSALGYIFTWIFDAPRIRWTPKSAFLFNAFFTLLFAMIFGMPAIGVERAEVIRGEGFSTVTLTVGFVSGFLSSVLAGVLNNLKAESSV